MQVLLPEKLVKVLLQSLHGTVGEQPGTSKRMQETRQRYYFPPIASYVRKWVRELCIQSRRKNNTQVTSKLIHITKLDFEPGDFMYFDLFSELPPSGYYERKSQH